MASRKVLTVNQVLDIMLRWLQTQDWEKAFLQVIPGRKLPRPAEGQGTENSDNESSDAQSFDGRESERVPDSIDDEGWGDQKGIEISS
jgi:tRNA (guanine9-N1)-methyltransferase